jgi:hypothetical protein
MISATLTALNALLTNLGYSGAVFSALSFFPDGRRRSRWRSCFWSTAAAEREVPALNTVPAAIFVGPSWKC